MNKKILLNQIFLKILGEIHDIIYDMYFSWICKHFKLSVKINICILLQ